MVLLRGLRIAGAGVTLGVAGALFAGRLLSALLFEVSATDGATRASVAMLASFFPVRASARIDPLTALRAED